MTDFDFLLSWRFWLPLAIAAGIAASPWPELPTTAWIVLGWGSTQAGLWWHYSARRLR